MFRLGILSSTHSAISRVSLGYRRQNLNYLISKEDENVRKIISYERRLALQAIPKLTLAFGSFYVWLAELYAMASLRLHLRFQPCLPPLAALWVMLGCYFLNMLCICVFAPASTWNIGTITLVSSTDVWINLLRIVWHNAFFGDTLSVLPQN